MKKVIHEELWEGREGGLYQEVDMEVTTRKREFILPKTAWGREQKLSPSLLLTTGYMQEVLDVDLSPQKGMVYAVNHRNDQYLPLPDMQPKSAEEFYRMTADYIAACPKDYDELLERYHEKEHTTIKFSAGDIFRQQLTPTLYSYGLILGKTRQMERWPELPAEHPLRHVGLCYNGITHTLAMAYGVGVAIRLQDNDEKAGLIPR